MRNTIVLLSLLCLVGAAAPAPALTVHMHNSAYDPAKAEIHVGDVVEFVNDDEMGHTVTDASDKIDSGDISAHKRWKYTFKTAGTYAYTCTYHPWMKGSIVVSP